MLLTFKYYKMIEFYKDHEQQMTNKNKPFHIDNVHTPHGSMVVCL